MIPDDGDEPLSRLDPDAAARGRGADPPTTPPSTEPSPTEPPSSIEPRTPPGSPRPQIDTRRYRWAIGIIGLVLVAAISIYEFATRGVGTTGVAPGHRLHWFAAPLADSDFDGDANLRPSCTLAHHDPRALNLCLDARRSAVVLSLFSPRSAQCERQVDALQTLSRRYRGSPVQFLAVAVDAGHGTTARLVRTHHWTIPVAYDADGAVGDQYGVAICPMAELAARGGTVRDRLIGDRWESAAALAPRVAALVAAAR